MFSSNQFDHSQHLNPHNTSKISVTKLMSQKEWILEELRFYLIYIFEFKEPEKWIQLNNHCRRENFRNNNQNNFQYSIHKFERQKFNYFVFNFSTNVHSNLSTSTTAFVELSKCKNWTLIINLIKTVARIKKVLMLCILEQNIGKIVIKLSFQTN